MKFQKRINFYLFIFWILFLVEAHETVTEKEAIETKKKSGEQLFDSILKDDEDMILSNFNFDDIDLGNKKDNVEVTYKLENIYRKIIDPRKNNKRSYLDGTSYIHLAAVSDKPKIVEELLKRGADPNIRILLRGVLSDRYVTALELAQVVQSHKVQEILLHYGAEHLEVLPPEERLFHAVYHNELENVRNLIKSGTPLEPQDNKSVSALFQAALMGYIQMASLLLENGAKVNFGNETALHAACKTGNTLMTDLLLKKGADPYQKCTLDGKTAADHGVHFPGISKLLKDYDKKMEKKESN